MRRVESTVRGAVAIIVIDHPPVNAIDRDLPGEIGSCLDAVERDPAVRAAVLTGAGRNFIAGADIRQLGNPEGGPEIHPLLERLENFSKPVVVAIHGSAQGGGLEVAMAGHYRVAARDAQLGQPEVNLGIIPGAEGTQRLPRWVGVARALDRCVGGAPMGGARDALAAGIVDAIVEGDLITEAIAFALARADEVGPWPRTSERMEKLGTPGENEPLFENGMQQAAKIRRKQTAPLRVIEAIRAAMALPFEQGGLRERALFQECIDDPQSKAMIHAFLAEREAAKVPGLPRDRSTRGVASVGIVGAGAMGDGIAMAFANAGIRARLKDTDQAALDCSMATIRKNYENSVRKGRLTPETVEQRLGLIQPQLTYEGFEQADLIIEAVFENLALKKEIFTELDRAAKPDCILASNTSTLNIDAIAASTSRPQSVVGLHFFSPSHVMRLVEIVRGAQTSAAVLADCLSLARKLKKVGVVVGNCPGFVGNRIFGLYLREAQFMVEEGATPWQVDRGLYNWGMAMGIFAVDDLAGIDVAWRVKQEQKHLQKPGARVPRVLDKLYAMGRLGQKTGAVWHRYDENRAASPDREIEALIERTAREAGVERRAIADDEIIERCIYAMVNEGAGILEEGFASRASDIDVIYLAGFGFPAYRGGPMWYADAVGLGEVYRRVEEFHKRYGELWTPAPLLARLAAEGGAFASFDSSKAQRASQ